MTGIAPGQDSAVPGGGSTGEPEQAGRGHLERRPNGRDPGELAELLHDFRDAWGIDPPDAEGQAWIATPRRSGFPHVTGQTAAELRARLQTAADAAGLTDMRALEEEFGGWRVWRSSDGAWWASRSEGRLADEQFDAGLHATVGDVRRPSQLRVLLGEQARIKEWAADHQWQVPGATARRALGLPAEGIEFTRVGAPHAAPDDT